MNSSTVRRENWHIGKEIPIALVLGMALQTGGWIWWAATLSTKVEDLSLQIAALSADKYTKTDASKDGALVMQRLTEHERRIDNLERKK